MTAYGVEGVVVRITYVLPAQDLEAICLASVQLQSSKSFKRVLEVIVYAAVWLPWLPSNMHGLVCPIDRSRSGELYECRKHESGRGCGFQDPVLNTGIACYS